MEYIELIVKYHNLFDYMSYKAFKKALTFSKNIFNMDIEHLFLGIYYTNSELLNNFLGEEKTIYLVTEIEKIITKKELIPEKNSSKDLIRTLAQAEILSRYNFKVISPFLLLISILLSKNNVSRIIKKSSLSIS